MVRALVPVFRCGLGGLFGGRLLLLTTIGRATGRERYVVLEVVDHPQPDRVVIASGFGTAAQWYRNLAANGWAEVLLSGRHALPAVPVLLDRAQSRAQLVDYAAAHPVAWTRLLGAMAVAQDLEDPDIRLVELTLDRS
jgi:deazaflavin-dependent oxidoreductase (nitroreductase family)